MMPTTVNPLHLRRVMGRETWSPPQPFGPCGWRLFAYPRPGLVADRSPVTEPSGTIIVTVSELPDAERDGDWSYWTHASMSWVDRVPTYDELVQLKRAVWGDDGEAYSIHPSADRHVNLHPHALHLWGRADGARVLPDFAPFGSI